MWKGLQWLIGTISILKARVAGSNGVTDGLLHLGNSGWQALFLVCSQCLCSKAMDYIILSIQLKEWWLTVCVCTLVWQALINSSCYLVDIRFESRTHFLSWDFSCIVLFFLSTLLLAFKPLGCSSLEANKTGGVHRGSVSIGGFYRLNQKVVSYCWHSGPLMPVQTLWYPSCFKPDNNRSSCKAAARGHRWIIT